MALIVLILAQLLLGEAPKGHEGSKLWQPPKLPFDKDELQQCTDKLIAGATGCGGWNPEQILARRCQLAARAMEARASINGRTAELVTRQAVGRGLYMVLRPVTSVGRGLRAEGYLPKPMYVKQKSCKAEDGFTGGPVGCLGLVLWYKPTPPPDKAQAFEALKKKILAELEKQLGAKDTSPEARERLYRLIHKTRAVTLESAKAWYGKRLKESTELVEGLSVVAVNAMLHAEMEHYLAEDPATLARGRPMIGFKPMYPNEAAYWADHKEAKGKANEVPKYIVALDSETRRVVGYTGDLDLFDVHVQRAIAEDANVADRYRLNLVPWARSQTPIEQEPTTQLPSDVANLVIPLELNQAGADVLHGPHIFWRDWITATSHKDMLESVFTSIVTSHQEHGGNEPLVLVTPACNLCSVYGPDAKAVAALRKELESVAKDPGRIEEERTARGPQAMTWNYKCIKDTAIFRPAEAKEDTEACATAGAPCTTNSDCCTNDHICLKATPSAPNWTCVPKSRCANKGTACALDGDVVPCCEGLGCNSDNYTCQ